MVYGFKKLIASKKQSGFPWAILHYTHCSKAWYYQK